MAEKISMICNANPARSEQIERFARKIGFYAFNRWAKNQGLAMETTLQVIRAVY